MGSKSIQILLQRYCFFLNYARVRATFLLSECIVLQKSVQARRIGKRRFIGLILILLQRYNKKMTYANFLWVTGYGLWGKLRIKNYPA